MERIVVAEPNWQNAALPVVTQKLTVNLYREVIGRTLRKLARVLTWAGIVDDAERLGTEAMKALGDDAEFAFLRGRWALARGQRDDAIVQFRSPVERLPEFVPLRFQLALAQINSGEYEDAVVQLNKAIDMVPKNAEAFYLYGMALQALDRSGATVPRSNQTAA